MMDELSTRDVIRKAWREAGEPVYRKVGLVISDSETAKQVQVERWRDMVDWLDTREGRAFLVAAFPETGGYLYPSPSRVSDANYQNHIAKCRAIVDGMGRSRGRWEVLAPDDIIVPRRSPLLFTGLGFLAGAVVGAGLLGIVGVILL